MEERQCGQGKTDTFKATENANMTADSSLKFYSNNIITIIIINVRV